MNADLDVIQDLCLNYECRDARLAGAEKGPCVCPCHDMNECELESFLEMSTGITKTRIWHAAEAVAR